MSLPRALPTLFLSIIIPILSHGATFEWGTSSTKIPVGVQGSIAGVYQNTLYLFTSVFSDDKLYKIDISTNHLFYGPSQNDIQLSTNPTWIDIPSNPQVFSISGSVTLNNRIYWMRGKLHGFDMHAFLFFSSLIIRKGRARTIFSGVCVDRTQSVAAYTPS